MRQYVIGLSLTLGLGAFSGPARASRYARPASTLPTPQPYFKTCEKFLDALTDDHVEGFFLNQANAPGERLQLLLDYGVVLSERFERALRGTDGFAAVTRWPRESATRDIHALRRDPVAMRGLVDQMLDRMAEPMTTASFGSARLDDLRTRRFVEALRERPDFEEYALILTGVVDAIIARTLREARVERANRIFTSRWGTAGLGVGSLGSFAGTMAIVMSSGPPGGMNLLLLLASVFGGVTSSTCFGLTAIASAQGDNSVSLTKPPATSPLNALAPGTVTVNIGWLEKKSTSRGGSVQLPPPRNRLDVNDIDRATPVELAYVGLGEAADVIDQPLPSSVLALREASHGLASVERAARRLLQGEENLRDQLVFAGAVDAAGDSARAAILAFDEQLRERRENLANLLQRLDDLEKKCFAGLGDAPSDDGLRRRELVICRLRHARPRLQDVVISGGFEAEIADQARPIVDALLDTVGQQPRTPADWRSAAARALDLADDLRRLTSSDGAVVPRRSDGP